MFFVDVANQGAIILTLFIMICFMYIGKEAKNAKVALMPLIVFVVLLVMHSIQLVTLPTQYENMITPIGNCLVVDFIMIFISYLVYLWIDDIEARAKKIKSVNNCLDWLWKKV